MYFNWSRKVGLKDFKRKKIFLLIVYYLEGTRALIDYLNQHPSIAGNGPEIHFFNRNYNLGKWFSH
jgi:hypothetical protein